MAARHRQAEKALRAKPLPPVPCGECATPARLVTGAVIYPRRPDLAGKAYWRCTACGAYVGCHPGTQQPLGTPCSPTTRAARLAAHAAFDPLWQAKVQRDGVAKKEARGSGYRWLAGQLGLDRADCHIGLMDAATARRVVDLCARRDATPSSPSNSEVQE